METVLDGASALYGSDAVAGVVNILTRDDFEGMELEIGSTDVEGAEEHSFQVLFGTQGERVGGIMAASFTHSGLLLNREREVTNVKQHLGNGHTRVRTRFATARPR